MNPLVRFQHLRHRDSIDLSHKGVCEFAHDAFNGAIVDVEISAIQITDGFLTATVDAFTDEPCMQLWIQLLPCDGESQLQRHIEPRSWRRCFVQLDA